jgi:N,N'-diacetyllegionaminate synthase
MNKTFNINGRKIGSGEPAYIVAEIGINHNGDVELAKKMMALAKECGADAVKFQNYFTEDFLNDDKERIAYRCGEKEIEESQYALFKRCELSYQDLSELYKYSKYLNIDFHSTPTSNKGVDDLVDLGVEAIKNGSDFLGDIELIKYMARTNKLVVLSTGMSTLGDIYNAVTAYKDAGGENLILLHCTSNYPTKFTDINIKKIGSISSAFGLPVGFSDHSIGSLAAILAVHEGACWIEKHFTSDKNLIGPDHSFSCDGEEFDLYVKDIRNARLAIGSSIIEPSLSEIGSIESFKLSCAASRDLLVGDIIGRCDIIFSRPGYGVKPLNIGLLLGKKISKEMKRNELFSLSNIM